MVYSKFTPESLKTLQRAQIKTKSEPTQRCKKKQTKKNNLYGKRLVATVITMGSTPRY